MGQVLSQGGWFEQWIHINLDTLSEYVVLVEELLGNKFKSLTSWIEKEASKEVGEQQEDLYEFYADDYNQLSNMFPSILRSSLFITLYSFLENQLIFLCERLHRQHGYPIKLADLRGEGIVRAQSYLKKVVNIDFPDQTSSWDDIVSYNRIRSFIIHNGGQLDKSNKAKKAESFINTRPSITLDDLRYIQFSKDFCLEVNGTLRNFFLDLFKVLPRLD